MKSLFLGFVILAGLTTASVKAEWVVPVVPVYPVVPVVPVYPVVPVIPVVPVVPVYHCNYVGPYLVWTPYGYQYQLVCGY